MSLRAAMAMELDTLLARVLDVVLSFPYLLVAIVLAAVYGASLTLMIFVIAFFSFAAVARTVRGQVLSIREQAFVEAARALGASRRQVLLGEILPNLAAPVTVLASLLLPSAIVLEATLSFLGAGVSAPSWGAMLNEAQGYYRTAWWFLLVPAALLLVTTLACNLLGDALRDAVAGR